MGLARVVISGYYGFGNAGDEVILAALLRVLQGHQVTVLSRDPAGTTAEHGVGAVPRAGPAAVLRALRGCDLLVSGGGGLLQDVTGPASVPYYLGVVVLARALGRPVMIYAQGIGPLRAAWARRALGVLRGVQAITVRDAESAEYLRAAGVPPQRVEVTADAALSLPAPGAGEGQAVPPPELAALGIAPGQRVVAVAPRPTSDPAVLRQLAAAAAGLQERLGAAIVLVPMQWPEDVPPCEAIRAAMGGRASILRLPPAPLRYPAVFAGFDLVLGMRLHALILAVLARRAAVGLSYDPKIDTFLENLGPGRGLPLHAPREQIMAAALSALEAVRADPAALDAAVNRLQALAARNNAILLGLLGGGGGAPQARPYAPATAGGGPRGPSNPDGRGQEMGGVRRSGGIILCGAGVLPTAGGC